MSCTPKIPPSDDALEDQGFPKFDTNIAENDMDANTNSRSPPTYHKSGTSNAYHNHWDWTKLEVQYLRAESGRQGVMVDDIQ